MATGAPYLRKTLRPHRVWKYLVRAWQLRIDRQSKSFLGGLFGFRQIAFRVTEICKTFLQMQRHRIIDIGPNPLLGKKSAELIPPAGNAYNILIIGMPPSITLQRQDDLFRQPMIRKKLPVTAGV